MGVSLLCLLSRKARIRCSKTLYVALTSVFRSLHEPFPTCNASGRVGERHPCNYIGSCTQGGRVAVGPVWRRVKEVAV
jgi:hypothetical protein